MDQKEEWRPIPGYEGLYEASNLGRVKSLRRNIILSPEITRDGYHRYALQNKGIKTRRFGHRITWASFENSEILLDQTDVVNKVINHKNGVKSDNRLCNLEECSSRENVLHAFAHGLRHPTMRKPVLCVETNIIYPSATHAARDAQSDHSFICKACRGEYETAHGLHWKYINERKSPIC